MFDDVVQTQPETGYSFPKLAVVHDYWQGLREARRLPYRADLDPKRIREALHHAFLLDTEHPTQSQFRIAGSALSDLLQRDVRFENFRSLFAIDHQDYIGEVLNDVCRLPATARLNFEIAGLINLKQSAQMILLPMADAQGRTSRILGCLDFEDVNGSQFGPASLIPSGSVIRLIEHIGPRSHNSAGSSKPSPRLIYENKTPRPSNRSKTPVLLKVV
jgi:hypothetical protein